MIIRHMKGTFGTLNGEELQLGEGLNIIYAPNESGKSTWCAFLRAMLYGIDTAQRAKGGKLPDKTKYAPWSGALMEGELVAEHGGKSITLRRTSPSARAPMRDFSAVYTGTDIPVPGMTAADAGQQLTGVSADVFCRSAFIGQGGVAVTGTPELEKRISAIVTSGEEESSYTEADALLRGWQRKRRSGQHGALPELEREIAAAEEKLQRLQGGVQEQKLLDQELEETQRELGRLTAQMNDARRRQRRDALSRMGEEKTHLHDMEQAMEAARRDAAEKRTALEQTQFGVTPPEEAAQRAEKDAQQAGVLGQAAARTRGPFLWIGALVLAALAAVLGFLVTRPLFYAAGALAVLALILLAYTAGANRRAAEAAAQLQKLLAGYGAADIDGIYAQADSHRAAYRACQAAMAAEQRALAALEDAREHQCETHERLLQELDFENGESEAAALFRQKQALEQVAERLRAQQAQRAGAAQATGDPMAIESELRQLRAEHDALQAQYAAIALAVEALGRADAEIQTRFSPQLAQKAAEYLDFLTEGRYDGVALARDFSAKAKRSGDVTPRETGYLSAGAADLLYLSVRLAMCELALESDEPCPIVLDDTLVNFDDARARRAMELFHEIAQHRQVILFTCHSRDYPGEWKDDARNRI